MPVCSPGTEQACPLGLAASHHATIGGVRGENRRIGYRRGQSTKLKKGYRLQYTSNLSFRWDRGGSEGRFTHPPVRVRVHRLSRYVPSAFSLLYSAL